MKPGVFAVMVGKWPFEKALAYIQTFCKQSINPL
jgi:hypothetical protein